MAMHIMGDLSLVDIVGLGEGELPSTDDPVEIFAFVSEFSSKRLREVEKALQKRAEPGYKPVLLAYKADANPKKKKKKGKEISSKPEPLKADHQEAITGPSCGFGPLQDLKEIRSCARNKSLQVLVARGVEKVLADAGAASWSGLLAAQEADAQLLEGGNKRRRPAEALTEKIKKKPKVVVPAAAAAGAGPDPPPDLPDNLRDMIGGMGGINPVLVIQKSLFKTDLAPQQNRLSISVRVMKNKFLEAEEEELLKDRKNDKPCNKIDTTLIDTKGEVWKNLPLRRWEMRKQKGSNGTIMYVLTDPWIKLALNNRLKQNDVVQLWAFRADQKLCFALVKL